MVITSFGILVYSVFTIVAGCLNDNSFEPPALVVANGLADFVQVIIFVENTLTKNIMDYLIALRFLYRNDFLFLFR